jgi:hypothetical protein
MQSTHDKLDIAYEMLDGAINALLDFKQYFVATNLAGVAEELYGYVIQFDGGTNSKKVWLTWRKSWAGRMPAIN